MELNIDIKLLEDTVKELSTIDWIRRCADPLGMDENGNLFDLNPKL